MAKVLVTGATGFIAGHVIHQLVEAGHEVIGTARSAARAGPLNEALSAYAGKPISIEIREADLSSDKGWAEAAQGMDYVQHIASPIPANVPKDANELIIPARDGALRVLKAAKAAGVKRVVMTSSMAACAYGWGDQRPNPVTEEHWSQDNGGKRCERATDITGSLSALFARALRFGLEQSFGTNGATFVGFGREPCKPA